MSNYDSQGNPFILLCEIWHIQGEKQKTFFGLWSFQGEVVKIPMRYNRYMGEPTEEVIKELTEKGFTCTLID